jgi:hypothetical protein
VRFADPTFCDLLLCKLQIFMFDKPSFLAEFKLPQILYFCLQHINLETLIKICTKFTQMIIKRRLYGCFETLVGGVFFRNLRILDSEMSPRI